MSKTFRTQGAGSSQTLHEIEDEKIPVYDTKAEADADLANLAEGQIVGTKDASNDYESELYNYVDAKLATTTTEVAMDVFKTGSKAQLYKSGNNVQFRYFVADPSTFNSIADATWTTIATIPEGLRPKSTIYLAMQGSNGGKVGSIQIHNAGVIQIYKFTGETFGWEFSIQCDYNIDSTNSNFMSVNTLKDAKDYTDARAVRKYDYTMTGTSNAIADTQTLVNHILTLGKGTYAGEFKRTGITFGNYELTYFIDGDGGKSVTGLVTYGIGQSSGDQTYQVSYTLSPGASNPTWVIRPISNVFSKEYFGSDTMDQIWDQAQQNQTLRIGCLPYNDPRNPTLAEYQSYGIPAQNIEVHAGYYTVTAYSFDGRAYTYDKTSGWVNTTARDIQKYDIVVPKPGTQMGQFEALRYHLLNANWTYLIAKTNRVCTGRFELAGYYFGQYIGSHHGNGYMTITGSIDTGGLTHTFSAFYDPANVQWKLTIDGQSFIDIDGGFTFTVRRIDNMSVYNITGAGTYQAFITAMNRKGLLGRPSRGEALIVPDASLTVNNKHLLTLDPPYTRTWTAGSGWWVQNPEFYNIDTSASNLRLEWAATTTVSNVNLWGINWGNTTIQANLEIMV